MKSAAVLAAVVVVQADAGSSNGINPIQKVVQMLTNMKTNGIEEKEAENKVFNDYTEFVTDRRGELNDEIKIGREKGEKLTATIAKATSDIDVYTNKVDDLVAEIASLEASKKGAEDMRAAAKAQFEKDQTDHQETLYAIERAVHTLSEQNYDRPQAMLLLQKQAQAEPGMRRVLAAVALTQQDTDEFDALSMSGAPTVAAYESQTGGVIEMLTGLNDKFRAELGDLEKEEMNQAHNHNMVVTDLDQQIAATSAQRDEMSEAKSTAQELLATSKGELAEVKSMLAEAEKNLSETNAVYETKKSQFETNQQVRTEELAALAKAIEIMASPEATGNYEGNVKVLLQKPLEQKAASFLQLRGRATSHTTAQAFLKQRAAALKSRTLSAIVMKMSDSPFAKVITMVTDLLAKLKQEAAEEAEHKAYCDEELKKNKLKRDKLSSQASDLIAQADQKRAAVADMAETITRLAEEQVQLRGEMKEATATRTEEKKANLKSIEESKVGETATQNAIKVLKEFYDKQGAGLVQVKQAPEMEAYGGMQTANGGVLGMLEVIESDFARVVADTTAQEDSAAREYNNFMDTSEADLKAKHDSEADYSLKKDQADFERERFEKDLAATNKELDAANEYYGALKPQCVNVDVSFEERAAKREEEIQALKQAWQMLANKGS